MILNVDGVYVSYLYDYDWHMLNSPVKDGWEANMQLLFEETNLWGLSIVPFSHMSFTGCQFLRHVAPNKSNLQKNLKMAARCLWQTTRGQWLYSLEEISMLSDFNSSVIHVLIASSSHFELSDPKLLMMRCFSTFFMPLWAKWLG